MSDWIELDKITILNISNGSTIELFLNDEEIEVRFYYRTANEFFVKKSFYSDEEAIQYFDNLNAQLIPKTIHNDCGPDNVSTSDDIAETSELESSMKDIEDIKKQIDWLRILKEKVIGLDTKEFKEILSEITIHNDYGPDNVSTPDDIAETNELESLRGAIEDAMNIIIEFNKDKKMKLKYHCDFLIKEIERTLKPFC